MLVDLRSRIGSQPLLPACKAKYEIALVKKPEMGTYSQAFYIDVDLDILSK